MPRKLALLPLLSLMAFAAVPHRGLAQEPAPASESAPQPDNLPSTDKLGPMPPDYSNGLKAMNESRWNDALQAFDKVATRQGDYADAAEYWKAYNLVKLGRKEDARATCRHLRTSTPNSKWNSECAALRLDSARPYQVKTFDNLNGLGDLNNLDIDIDTTSLNMQLDAARDGMREASRLMVLNSDEGGRHSGRTEKPHDPNDDLKLLALNSLMQQEPEKALPILRAFILSDKPFELRRRALFVLGENKTPGAQQLLLEIATRNTDPELQRYAVQTLASMRGKAAAPDLVKIYKESSDHAVKRAAVSGLFVAHDATDMVDLARGEKDMDMKREVVSQLSIMHDPAATAYMEELLK